MAIGQGLMQKAVDLFRTPSEPSTPARSRRCGRIIGILAVVLLAGSSSFGQIAVQPIMLNKPVRPGRRFVTTITLQNQSRDLTETITLSLMELTQTPGGMWQEFEPDDPNYASVPRNASCREWLHLPTDSVTVGPYGSVPINMSITVPPGIRGHYFAALVARSEPRLVEEEGMLSGFSVEYIVPIILEVQGMVLRQKIELVDADLEFRPQSVDETAASMVSMNIKNNGGTFSHVVGMIRVWGQWEDHEQKVADLRFRPMAIMPGVEFHLTRDIERFLPAGPYKLEGYIYVDGRRGGMIRKEVQFSGDPRAVSRDVKTQVPLDIVPMDVVLESTPGAMRTTHVTVQNGSEEVVNVNTRVVIPAQMQQAFTAKGVKGEELSCANWLTVKPEQFSLQPFGRRNITLMARMPKSLGNHPNYYGILVLDGTYPDGQRAGVTGARVSVDDTRVNAIPEIAPQLLSITESSPSRYLATATFVNTGETHIQPRCQGVVTYGGQAAVSMRFLMTSNEAYRQDSMMMPMETRMFSGVLDVSGMSPGTYVLTAALEYEGGNVQQQRAIEIVSEGGQKVARIVDMSQVPKTVIKL